MKISMNDKELKVYGIVYLIINLKSDKYYVGITRQERGFDGRYPFSSKCPIERVYHMHKYNKEKNRSYNKHLLNSIKQYGFDSFYVNKVFDYAFSKEELIRKEKYWINYYDSFRNGYNGTLGGDGIDGFKHDEKFIKRLKRAISGTNNYNAKQVICLNTYEIFETMTEASGKYNIGVGSITNCCKGKTKSAGEMDYNTNLVWAYMDDFIKMSLLDIENKISTANSNDLYRKEKRVVCLNTKKIFNNLAEPTELYNLKSKICISDCCRGKQKSAGILGNGEKLTWMYENDYLKTSKDEILKKINEANNNIHYGKPKKIICITTNEVFDSLSIARDTYKVNNISACLHKRIKSAGKHPITGEALKWDFY